MEEKEKAIQLSDGTRDFEREVGINTTIWNGHARERERSNISKRYGKRMRKREKKRYQGGIGEGGQKEGEMEVILIAAM